VSLKILIMVLSCRSHPFDKLMSVQKETWDSINVEGVETVFYRGGNALIWNGNVLEVPCDDGYDWMHWKMKLSIDEIWDKDWDVIFRTNASSYVDKKRLLFSSRCLPTIGVYHGITGET